MRQKTVLLTTPILLVLVTLSIFTTPAAALKPVDDIEAEGKFVLWCKGQFCSGEADFELQPEVPGISIMTEFGLYLEWEKGCVFKIYTMTIFTSSTPEIPDTDMPELKFVIAFVCGDTVTCYAFGWGCFFYFKGTVMREL